jgi:hypothetical protein
MLLLRRASGGGSLLISSDIAHAIEMAHEGIPLVVIQRQLGHANLGITSIYLQGIDSSEIIDTVRRRRSARPPDSRGADRSGRRPGPSRTGGHTLGWRRARHWVRREP